MTWAGILQNLGLWNGIRIKQTPDLYCTHLCSNFYHFSVFRSLTFLENSSNIIKISAGILSKTIIFIQGNIKFSSTYIAGLEIMAIHMLILCQTKNIFDLSLPILKLSITFYFHKKEKVTTCPFKIWLDKYQTWLDTDCWLALTSISVLHKYYLHFTSIVTAILNMILLVTQFVKLVFGCCQLILISLYLSYFWLMAAINVIKIGNSQLLNEQYIENCSENIWGGMTYAQCQLQLLQLYLSK